MLIPESQPQRYGFSKLEWGTPSYSHEDGSRTTHTKFSTNTIITRDYKPLGSEADTCMFEERKRILVAKQGVLTKGSQSYSISIT